MSYGKCHGIVIQSKDILRSGDQGLRSYNAVFGKRFESVMHVEKIAQIDGSEFEWEMCQPNLLLSQTLNASEDLAKLYVEKLEEKPCSREKPWNILLTFDEFTPGSISFPQLSRKMMNLAFNFLELGGSLLRIPCTWIIPVAVRATYMSNAIGGWSACLALFLRLLLLGDLGLQSTGVTFLYKGNAYELFGRLKAMLSDGEGLKHALDIMGYNGIRPCLKCQNVLKKNSGLAHLSDGAFVEVGCSDSSKFVPSTPADLDREIAEVMAAYRKRQAGSMNQTNFKKVETAYGIHANPNGIMFCTKLRLKFSVLAVLHEDWMHGTLQDGCVTHAFHALLESCTSKMQNCGYRELEAFVKGDWRFADFLEQRGTALWKLFKSQSNTSEYRIKGTASDLLTLYMLLRYFCFCVLLPIADSQGIDMKPEIGAFEAWCNVMDKIMFIKTVLNSSADFEQLTGELLIAIDGAIAAHIDVYGNDGITPKSHRMQHIPEQISGIQYVFDSFLIEKLHLTTKAALAN